MQMQCDEKETETPGKEEVTYVEPTNANEETVGQGARNEMTASGIWVVASEVRMLQDAFSLAEMSDKLADGNCNLCTHLRYASQNRKREDADRFRIYQKISLMRWEGINEL